MSEVVSFYFLASVFSYRLYKRISHPVVIFNLLWFILLLISIYGDLANRMDIFQPRDVIYNIFLIGGISYNLGAILMKLFSPHVQSVSLRKDTFVLREKTINVIFLIELVLFLYYSFKTLDLFRLLASGQTYEVVRKLYFSDELMTSTIEKVIVIFVFDPLLTFTTILFAINAFVHIFPKKVSAVMLVNVLLRTIISGGRTSLFELGCLILLSAVYLGKSLNFSKRKWASIAMALFSIVSLVVIISSGRHGDEGGIMEIAANNLVNYFIGSFPFFDDLLQCKDYLPPTYGIVTLGGFFDIFIQAFRFVGLTDMELTYISTGAILEDFRAIGEYTTYNAMPTMYYYFFTDFRELGYIICPFLFGGISVLVFNNLIKKGTIFAFVNYLILMILVLESSFNWQLERVSFFMVIVFSFLLFYNDKNNNVDIAY